MAVPAWPSTLPKFWDGLRVKARPGFVRTPNSIGPAIQRRRYTATPTDYIGQMAFDQTQMAEYETFYHVTLKEGSLAFTMFDSATGQNATFRFVEPTGFTLRGGDADGQATVFIGNLRLERLP